MSVPTLPLNQGTAIPQLGLGTWLYDDDMAARLIPQAVELGYRHIDTAVVYGNEVGVGRGVAAAGVDRSELFVTTKLGGEYQGDDRAIAGLDESLKRLRLDYVDLLLIHWPQPKNDRYVDTWRTFEKLLDAGKARAIGVSNFKPAHLQRLLDETGVVPAVNQVELNPLVARQDHQSFDNEHGIVTVSYTPLGRRTDLLTKPLIVEIAGRLGVTSAQLVLRWHIEQGLVPIPKSQHLERLAENIDVFSFTLSAEDMAQLGSLDGTAEKIVDSDVDGH